MKTTKLKGFTLIELIVVMGIFGIIMAGAMSLVTPTTKVMVQSETYENGNAAVTSVTNYLKKTLASAEMLRVYNDISVDPESLAKELVDTYYSDLLKSSTDPDKISMASYDPDYADGKVHVMVIDNSDIHFDTEENKWVGSSKISEYTYKFDSFASAKLYDSSNVTEENYVPSAINKAYYDSYNLQIKFGIYDSDKDDGDDTTEDWLDPYSVGTVSAINGRIQSDRMMEFTVRAETLKKANGEYYSFLHNSIFELPGAKQLVDCPFYYQIAVDSASTETPKPNKITQIGKAKNSSIKNPYAHFTETGNIFDSYCFVYSYGSEINVGG